MMELAVSVRTTESIREEGFQVHVNDVEDCREIFIEIFSALSPVFLLGHSLRAFIGSISFINSRDSVTANRPLVNIIIDSI